MKELITPRISPLMAENSETQYNKKCLSTKFSFFKFTMESLYDYTCITTKFYKNLGIHNFWQQSQQTTACFHYTCKRQFEKLLPRN